MASSNPSRRPSGRSGRRSGSAASTATSSGSLPLLLGGAAVAVVVVLFLAFGKGGAGQQPVQASQSKQPAAVPAPPPGNTGSTPVSLLGAKAGRPPKTPPPSLAQNTLTELQGLLNRVKDLRNEAVTARTGAGDNQAARAKMSEARGLLEQWKAKVDAPLRWQEDAQLEGWAQPAEYVTLENLFATFQKLEKEVRMGGGG